MINGNNLKDMTAIASILYFLVILVVVALLVFLGKMLLFRRGKAYLFLRDAAGNKIGEIYLAQVRSLQGSLHYKIIDPSKGAADHVVGEVQVTAGKAIVRLLKHGLNPEDYSYEDVGEVDKDGNIFINDHGTPRKIGSCDPEGKRKIQNLWLLLHTDVISETQPGEIFGRCTESLRFRKRKPDEVTLLARAAAVLMLYKPVMTPEDELRHPASVPFGHLALPAAIIYLAGFAIFSSLFNFHDLFPLIGHILSYTAAMILIYFVIIWILKLITSDMQMRGVPFGTWLTMINRNTGIRSWNVVLVIFLAIALAISIFIQGYQFLPLWLALLIGVILNMITFTSKQWTILPPVHGVLNIRYPAAAGAGPFNPYAGIPPDELVDKAYDWQFDSILKSKEIKANKTLTFRKKYIEDKRNDNPFKIDNDQARKDLYKSSKEVIRKSPDAVGDWLIREILSKIDEVARAEGLSRYDTMQLILSFCQHPNFDWIMDDVCDEIGHPPDYFRFPIETIFDKRGDCDCTALMAFMIFKLAGIPSAYLLMMGEGGGKHAAIAIGNVPDSESGAINGLISIRGKNYYFCETVGTDWKVGVLPEAYAERMRMFETEMAAHPEKVIVSEDF